MNLTVKKKLAKFTTLFAWILVVIIGFWFGRKIIYIFKYPSTNDAQVYAYINPVVSRVGGFIREVKYSDFEQVKKGDTLLIIDNREYVSDAQQIQADMDKQSMAVGALEAQEITANEESNEAKSAIDGAKAEVWKQQLEYNRYQELFNRKSATAQQLEKVKAQLEVNKSNLKKAQNHYQVALTKIHDIQAKQKVISAEKLRLGEVRNRKNIDVGYTVITAPYNGRLGKKTVEVGQMIKMGEHLVYIVNDEIPTWVMANFKETQIAELAIGSRIKVIADAYPDQEFYGKIEAFSPGTGSSFSLLPPDNATGNFVKIVQRIPVKIALNPENSQLNLLQAGMNVEVTLAP